MEKTIRVLVVEDSEDDALLLIRQLRRGGYDPVHRVISTCEEMNDALDNQAWDIIIADYSMPHFSGLEALKLVNQRNLDIPFIIVSGVIGEETAVEAMREGAHDYLMKGNLTRLIPAIEREMREVGMREERRKAEKALFESRRTLTTLMSNLPGMAYRCLIDRSWTMEFVSDGCFELTGYRPDDLLHNRVIPFVDLILPEYREMVWERTQSALNKNEAFQLLYRIKMSDGTIRWVWEKGRGVCDMRNQLCCIEGFITDITERVEAEEKIRQSLQEKEILLKEIHHRVKNNLQVIFSLLNLQAGYIRDPEAMEMFKESRNRVKSMAVIHEILYQSRDLARVNFAEYIRTLANNLYHSYGANPSAIVLDIRVDQVLMELDVAIPLGLIVNELMSNALKYAFPEGGKGAIRVDLHPAENEQVVLAVSDNGVGLPADFNFKETSTLGLQLVNTLTEQLNGQMEVDRREGTTFRFTFPCPGSCERREGS